MMTLTCTIGQVVEIGDVAAFRIMEKNGRRVKLAFNAPKWLPIRISSTGIIPQSFAAKGLTPPTEYENHRENRYATA